MENTIILLSAIFGIVLLLLFVKLVTNTSELLKTTKEIRKYQKFLALDSGFDDFINLTGPDGKFIQDTERVKKWSELKTQRKNQI